MKTTVLALSLVSSAAFAAPHLLEAEGAEPDHAASLLPDVPPGTR